MADFNVFPDNANAAFNENLRDDAPVTGPSYPLVGSPLHALVERQGAVVGSSRRLAFVPAQIR